MSERRAGEAEARRLLQHDREISDDRADDSSLRQRMGRLPSNTATSATGRVFCSSGRCI